MTRSVIPLLGTDLESVYQKVFDVIRRNTADGDQSLFPTSAPSSDSLDLKLDDYFFYTVLTSLDPIISTIAKAPGSSGINEASYHATDLDVDLDHASVQTRLMHTRDLIASTYMLHDTVIADPPEGPEPGMPPNFDQNARSLLDCAGTANLWTVFVAQIWVCVLSTVGSDAERARFELLIRHLEVHADLMTQKAILDCLDRGTYGRYADESKDVVDTFAYYVTTGIRRLHRQDDSSSLTDRAEILLLRRDPVTCGLIMYRLQMVQRTLGMLVAERFESILVAAHLYHACRLFTSTDPQDFPPWPDMDLWLQHNGRNNVFGGKIPETAEEACVSFSKMIGVSINGIRQMRVNDFDLHLPRAMIGPFRNGRRGGSGLRFQDPATLSPLLASKLQMTAELGTDADITMIEDFLQDRLRHAKEKERKAAGLPNGGGRSSTDKRFKFPMHALLTEMEQTLKDEIFSVQFDYLSFHLRCVRLVQTIFRAITSGMDGAPEEDLDPSCLTAVTLGIMQAAAQEEKKLGASGRGKRRPATNENQATQRRYTFGPLVIAGASMCNELRRPGFADTEARKMGLMP
ncbi:hypothetical protein V8E36_004012 [Tilletia maclaganii]